MSERPEVTYVPRHCPFLHKEGWAIVTKQADGPAWRVVNCLDKDHACFEQECAFTTDGGAWPFASPGASDVPSAVPHCP